MRSHGPIADAAAIAGTCTAQPVLQLQLQLRLVGRGRQRHWQAALDPAPDGCRRHFDSLPELIRWLAQLEWQTRPAGGLR